MQKLIEWILSLFKSEPETPSAELRKKKTLAWGNRVSPAFRQRVLDMSAFLGVNPDHLMAIMAFETGRTFDPAQKNLAGSGATGLIQFMPQTAIGLGTSVDLLAKMNTVEQLRWVQKYFMPYRGLMHTLSDMYMAVLWPRAVGKPDDYVLWDKQTRPTTYRQNAGLDGNKDAVITKFEAASRVYQMREEGRSAKNLWIEP